MINNLVKTKGFLLIKKDNLLRFMLKITIIVIWKY